MEITIESIKLTAEKAPRALGEPQDIYIKIEVLGEFSDKVKPVPKVYASELKAAIEALEKTAEPTY